MSLFPRAEAFLSRRFELPAMETSVGRECWAGFTNFLVMSYAIALVPNLLGADGPIDKSSIGVAICFGSAALCILMGLVANRPFALAPGLGIATIICRQLLSKDASGESLMGWSQAMGAVVIEGTIAVTLVTLGLHRQLASAIPKGLKCAIAIGIGAFLMKLGLQKGGILSDGEVRFDHELVPMTLVGFLVTLTMFISRWRHAALPLGIVITTALAYLSGVVEAPSSSVTDAGGATDGGGTAANGWLHLPGLAGALDCFGEGGVGGLTLAVVVLSLLLTDTFDSLGTSYTLTRLMGGLRGEEVPRLKRVLLVDSIGAVAGGAMGAGSITTYVESAAGIGSGGRTGLTATVTGLLFLVALFVTPVVGLVPDQATAPALIFIGFIMARAVKEIDFSEYEQGIPALLMIIIMPVAESITGGIGVGFIAYTLISVLKVMQRERPVLHPLMWVATGLFVIHFSAEWSR